MMKIIQWPNPPLIAAAIGFVISKYPQVEIHKVGATVCTIALIIWAYLEITAGVNIFRKILGAIVLLMIAISLFNQLV